jgi:DNA-binding transcriptional ArsR family regulator
MMMEEQLPELPNQFEIYLNKPYGGLFGKNAQTRIVEEIIADPYRDYRPKYFEEIIGASEPTIRNALKNLTDLGLLEKDTNDIQHPIYRLNLHSKKIIALTFLSYASIDDRDGSICMDEAVFDYYHKEILPKIEKTAIGTYQKYQFGGRTVVNVEIASDEHEETFTSIGTMA